MKIILYQGIDNDFYDQLAEAAGAFQCKVIQQSPEKRILLPHAFELKPQIIIVDSANSG